MVFYLTMHRTFLVKPNERHTQDDTKSEQTKGSLQPVLSKLHSKVNSFSVERIKVEVDEQNN